MNTGARRFTNMPDADPVEWRLRRSFAPLHKRALGLASGIAAALGVFLVTAFHVMVAPDSTVNLNLLAEYFYGYDVSWRGAFVGAWWSFVVAFVVGWFVAFVRNFVMATWMFFVRTKADLRQTTDFLDHI